MSINPNLSNSSASPHSGSRTKWRESIQWLFATMVGYGALCHAASWLAPDATSIAPIWFADGFALGLYLMTFRLKLSGSVRVNVVLGIFIANLIFGMASGNGWALMLAVSTINALQTVLAGEVINTIRVHSSHWLPVRRFAFFLLIGVALVNSLTAALSASAEVGLRVGEGSFVVAYWATFISDGLGILLMVPLMLAWSKRWLPHDAINLKRLFPEMLLMLFAVCATTAWAYARLPDASGLAPPYFYVGLPFLLWAAIRQGTRATTLALLVYVLIAVYFTARGLGPFVIIINNSMSVAAGIFRLQEFLIAFAGTILITMSILMERLILLRQKLDLERRYNGALRASDNLIFEIDQRTNRIVWAGDTERVLGVAAVTISTVSNWVARIHPDDRAQINGTRAKLLSGEWPYAVLEYRVRRDDASTTHDSAGNTAAAPQKTDYITVGVNAFAHMTRLPEGASERRVIGFVKDIGEKKRADAERRKLEIELRQAQKMEAIGQLAGGIAHDFNNILASIIGYGEMARNKAEDGTPLARHLDAVLKAGERGRVLISQILTFSRKTPEKKQVVNIADLTDEVVTLLRGSTPHTIEFRMVSDIALTTELVDEFASHDAIHVLGNATEIHQLVMNLATNGLQAMPDGGTLTIEVAMRDEPLPKTVMQGQLEAGRYAVISVADHGAGIDDATKSRMFEPFFTTKPTGKGTGLGLSLAMSIAKAHGGGIDVLSRVGEGTTFTVYLPVVSQSLLRARNDQIGAAGYKLGLDEKARETEGAVNANGTLKRGNDQCILLVDDEAPLRELAAEILAALGYQSVSYSTSAEALAAFARQPERFDAVLTDEVMPGLTGTQLAARIHALQPSVPIFIITGYGGSGFELRAQEAGVARILRKPYEAHELAEVLANAFSITR